MPLSAFRAAQAAPVAPEVTNAITADVSLAPASVAAGANVQLSGALLLVVVLGVALLAWKWPV
jgi:hypothetical protein